MSEQENAADVKSAVENITNQLKKVDTINDLIDAVLDLHASILIPFAHAIENGKYSYTVETSTEVYKVSIERLPDEAAVSEG